MEAMLFSLSAFSLILVGLFGVLTRRNLVRILLALNILETGVNLLLVSMGYFEGGRAPILLSEVTPASAGGFVDPLPHALVLTSIVIGVGTTALALTLILTHFRRSRSLLLAPEGAEAVKTETMVRAVVAWCGSRRRRWS